MKVNTLQQSITGIHHITAIASNPKKNLDFYAGILGLRFIKKTVNFDDPGKYHLHYGDERGSPGSVLTFFLYPGARQGRHGAGLVNTTTFSVPIESISFWEKRFTKYQVNYKNAQERLGKEAFIYFEDFDGMGLELVFNEQDDRKAFSSGTIPEEHAIRGFHSAEIWARGYERTGGLLTEQLDHKLIEERGNRFRFAASDSPGSYVDILVPASGMPGLSGAGTVHHIAFRTENRETQLKVMHKLRSAGIRPSPIMDRQYYQSIYFREPGDVLFAISTDGPGFTVDESLKELGSNLKLPPQLEYRREQIEQMLPDVSWPNNEFS